MLQSTDIELSPYLKTVLHDFFSHSLPPPVDSTNPLGGEEEGDVVPHNNTHRKTKKRRHQLIHIVCHNPGVPSVRNDVDIKARVQRREAELRTNNNTAYTAQQKDWQLVHEFLGWAQTAQHHYVYVYYVGPSSSSSHEEGTGCHSTEDMKQPKHWKLVSKDHLSLFHSRFSRSDIAALCRRLNSSDVTESGDGRCNLGLDVRFLVSRWLHSNNKMITKPISSLSARNNNNESGGYAAQLLQYRDEGCDEQMELVTVDEMRVDPPVESVSDFLARWDPLYKI